MVALACFDQPHIIPYTSFESTIEESNSLIKYDFDPTKPESLFGQALKMHGKSLRNVLSPAQIADVEGFFRSNKGYFGGAIEKYVFDKEPDTSPNPDFPEAGVELKTTGLKKSGNQYIAKERLVFGKIDFMNIINETWTTSSFLRKSSLILLMMYLFDKTTPPIDYRFKIIKLIDLLKDLPPRDVFQIQEDWEAIVDKIKAGRAHEISEGDTIYLGACTKGKTAKDRTYQPHADEMAMPRAFALKAKYLTFLANEGAPIIAEEYGSIFDTPTESVDIETVIQERFSHFIDLPIAEIKKQLPVELNPGAKSYYADLARGMLGIKKRKIAELEKAEIEMKIIRLQHSGTPKESMSFPAIDYLSIVDEDWETSTWRDMVTKKFLFVVFEYLEDGTLVFKGARFWNMPYSDLENHAKRVWSETVERIKNGRADDLPKISFDTVCHVRPHGRDSSDTTLTPDGRQVVKKSFWLNAAYIGKLVATLTSANR
jgi:DNA mismatch repair protein MutH